MGKAKWYYMTLSPVQRPHVANTRKRPIFHVLFYCSSQAKLQPLPVWHQGATRRTCIVITQRKRGDPLAFLLVASSETPKCSWSKPPLGRSGWSETNTSTSTFDDHSAQPPEPSCHTLRLATRTRVAGARLRSPGAIGRLALLPSIGMLQLGDPHHLASRRRAVCCLHHGRQIDPQGDILPRARPRLDMRDPLMEGLR